MKFIYEETADEETQMHSRRIEIEEAEPAEIAVMLEPLKAFLEPTTISASVELDTTGIGRLFQPDHLTDEERAAGLDGK
jgi:hypothetical protein